MLLRLTTIVMGFLLWVPVAQAWTWPVNGPVLQAFNYDKSHPYAAGQHRGIDIGASAAGELVVAPASGTVSFAGSVPTSGKSVTIQTPDGYSVTLTHLGSIAVAEGASVVEGATVGTIGPSGTPEQAGPYVHLGIRVTADPLGYLDPLTLLQPPTSTPPGPTGSGSAGSGSKAKHHARPTRAHARPAPSRGGLEIRSRPVASPAVSRTARSTRPATDERSRQRPQRPQRQAQARPASPRSRLQARTLQPPASVETRPLILAHAPRPLPASAAPRLMSRRPSSRPVQQPTQLEQAVQIGLAAGPGVVAGLAAIATALMRRRWRRREGDAEDVVHVFPPVRGAPVLRRVA